MKPIIQSTRYHEADRQIKYDIAYLLHRIWPSLSPMPDENIPIVHPEQLETQSFFIYLDEKIVSYAAVLQQTTKIDGIPFRFAGLSCVGTDPDYRHKGFGTLSVHDASEWIQSQEEIDFGVFTCEPHLSEFYCRIDGWTVVHDLVLIRNNQEDTLKSTDLDVAVLMQLISEKAKKNEKHFRNQMIVLHFPDNEFL